MLKRMTLYTSTRDGVVGMAPFISTVDGVVDYRTLDLYWGQPCRALSWRSLLGTVWQGMSL